MWRSAKRKKFGLLRICVFNPVILESGPFLILRQNEFPLVQRLNYTQQIKKNER